jgi:hypothetical protein
VIGALWRDATDRRGLPEPRTVVDWLLEDLRCHAGDVDPLDPNLLARLARLNRSQGLGLPQPGIPAELLVEGAGGWLELELLYRLRLESADPAALDVPRPGSAADGDQARALAELARGYLRSRGVPV